jgi:hypothetical protein
MELRSEMQMKKILILLITNKNLKSRVVPSIMSYILLISLNDLHQIRQH